MKNKIILPCLLGLALIFAGVPDTAEAKRNDRVKKVERFQRIAERRAKRLRKAFLQLNAAQKESFLSGKGASFDDSDDDGVPDMIEESSSRCDDDSNDDGISDRDDYYDDDDDSSDDDDNSSDDSGQNDSGQSGAEVEGNIELLSASQIRVEGTTFALRSSTRYLDDNNRTISKSSFSIGDCVEVEGDFISGVLTAEKVKEEDDC
jgi:hypothetical protein